MRRTAIVMLMVVGALFFAACESDLESGTPDLPPGFLEAEIPAGDLSGYLYLSQASPVTIPLESFGDPMDAAGNVRFTLIPQRLELNRIALLVGPNLDSFGGIFLFDSDLLAEIAVDVASSRTDMTIWRGGRNVEFVRGTSGWADAMEFALRSGEPQRFQDAYPDTWELMGLLPSDPPVAPVAAGFSVTSGDIMDQIAAKMGLNLDGLGQAFGTINVTEIVFAAYTDDTLAIPGQINRDFLSDSRVGAIVVARSTYPGAILSFFLDSFSGQMGLSAGPTINGEEVLYRESDGIHLLLKSLGNTIFLSVAPSKAMAEALMASAIGPHLEE